ncbi:MAG: carboxypeptidase-like regulatory domain-containing protein, partial [Blastocatellia bacterium]
MTWISILTLMLLAMTSAAYAQVLYGSLTGNVTDPSGAVVVGAKVEALNAGTGVSTSVVTDERGAYQFSNL